MPKAKQNMKRVTVPKKTKSLLKKEENSAKSLATSIARTLGTLGGGALGGPMGAKLGGDAAEWVAKITGFGDYNIEGNALMKEQVPLFMSSEDGVILTHKEYLTDVYGSTAFANQGGQSSSTVPWSGLINPGNSILFPWLSTLAQSFEMYQFLGLIFEFKSTSSNALNSTNTALGVVIATTNYDVLDNNFTTKQQAEAYEFTCSCKPAESMIHPVECKPGRNVLERYYVTGIESTNVLNGDPRIYYQGNFQLMTQGMQAVADIGELWVSYKIRLIRPKLPTPLNSNLPYTHIVTNLINGNWGTPTYKVGSSLTVNFVPITGQCFFPSVGRYFITCYSATTYSSSRTSSWLLNGSASCPSVFTSGGGIQDTNQLNYSVPSQGTASISNEQAAIMVDISNTNTDSITFPSYNNSSPNFYDIIIVPISSGFSSRNPFGDFIKGLVNREITDLKRQLKIDVPVNDNYIMVNDNNNNSNTTASNLNQIPPGNTVYIYTQHPPSPSLSVTDNLPASVPMLRRR